MTAPFPAFFLSHGAPLIAIEEDAYTKALAAFAAAQPRPEAIVVVSAHWEARGPIRVNANPLPSAIYDFGGFPERLYRLTYPAPGAASLAEEIAALLSGAGFSPALETARGWDHGVWVPLRLLYPEPSIPVVEISLPVPRTPAELVKAGAALASLRRRGVLLMGSGGIVHNLSRVRFGEKEAPVEDWARAFDEWIRERLERLEVEMILSYRGRAPHADLAVPTSEHFDPLFFVLGAALEDDRAVPLYEGFHYATLSMRCFALRS